MQPSLKQQNSGSCFNHTLLPQYQGKQWKIVNDYRIAPAPLGKGQFGEVFLCMKGQEELAVKIIKKSTLDDRKFNNLKNEISLLTKIQSANVIKLIDLQRTSNNFYLVMELCNGGDLSGMKEAKGRFKENEARLILQ